MFFSGKIFSLRWLTSFYNLGFGIKTREQVEKILVGEIQKHSIFYILNFVPLIGGILKWYYNTSGLDLLNRQSIIIFDDFERISSSNNESDCHEILGFIDFLSENKPIKIIVILNKDKIIPPDKPSEYFDSKYRTNFNIFPSDSMIIDSILSECNLQNDFHKEFLKLYFKIYLYKEKINYRTVHLEIENFKDIKYGTEEEKEKTIDMLNQNSSFMMMFTSYEDEISNTDYINKSLYISICDKKRFMLDINDFDMPLEITDKQWTEYINRQNKCLEDVSKLLRLLWKHGYNSLSITYNTIEPDGMLVEPERYLSLNGFPLNDDQTKHINDYFDLPKNKYHV